MDYERIGIWQENVLSPWLTILIHLKKTCEPKEIHTIMPKAQRLNTTAQA